jgi:hypothetical protein
MQSAVPHGTTQLDCGLRRGLGPPLHRNIRHAEQLFARSAIVGEPLSLLIIQSTHDLHELDSQYD